MCISAYYLEHHQLSWQREREGGEAYTYSESICYVTSNIHWSKQTIRPQLTSSEKRSEILPCVCKEREQEYLSTAPMSMIGKKVLTQRGC